MIQCYQTGVFDYPADADATSRPAEMRWAGRVAIDLTAVTSISEGDTDNGIFVTGPGLNFLIRIGFDDFLRDWKRAKGLA